MPITHLIHPKTGARLDFAKAGAILEEDGIMPASAVDAIIASIGEDKPAFNVRPSDVVPSMECRRQRVWMATHDCGANPLEMEVMLEGSALHAYYGAEEITVPKDGVRVDICGVPMRGRMDWLDKHRITDLKTSTPFWKVTYPPKPLDGSLKAKPFADIWEPDAKEDIAKWQIQLSIYAILLRKSGREAPSMGRVWRRWAGVKADKGRYKRFDFPLLSEAELEARVGEWIMDLADWLNEAKTDVDAWKHAEPDGRSIVGSRGNLWKCERCQLRAECDATGGEWVGF